MDFRRLQEQYEQRYLEQAELEHDDECPCRGCSLAMNYQNKTVVKTEEQKWEEWLKESTEPETEFTSEEIEFVNSINQGIGFTDEELDELEKLFGHQPSKPRDVKKDEKDHQEWTQLTCIHPKEYTIINEAGGTKFKYCKRCKKDLGDVK